MGGRPHAHRELARLASWEPLSPIPPDVPSGFPFSSLDPSPQAQAGCFWPGAWCTRKITQKAPTSLTLCPVSISRTEREEKGLAPVGRCLPGARWDAGRFDLITFSNERSGTVRVHGARVREG